MALSHPIKVFATRGSIPLAGVVCAFLRDRLPKELQVDGGLSLGNVKIERFANDNILVHVENVRDHLVVLIHSQVPPVDKRLIELFHLIDAIKNSHAADILVVFPYMPYARSDRKDQPRISTFSKTLAGILNFMGVRRVILLDPHDPHLKHYFDPAADEISAIYLLVDYLEREFLTQELKARSVMVFPDAGAAKRFERIPALLGLPEAYIPKERDNRGEARANGVVGDVEGKHCLMLDDEILTGGTAIDDVAMLLQQGAKSVSMVAVHPILSHKTLSAAKLVQRIEASAIERFIVTDSVPVHPKLKQAGASKFTVLPIAPLLAEAIAREVKGESLTALHQPKNVSLYR